MTKINREIQKIYPTQWSKLEVDSLTYTWDDGREVSIVTPWEMTEGSPEYLGFWGDAALIYYRHTYKGATTTVSYSMRNSTWEVVTSADSGSDLGGESLEHDLEWVNELGALYGVFFPLEDYLSMFLNSETSSRIAALRIKRIKGVVTPFADIIITRRKNGIKLRFGRVNEIPLPNKGGGTHPWLQFADIDLSGVQIKEILDTRDSLQLTGQRERFHFISCNLNDTNFADLPGDKIVRYYFSLCSLNGASFVGTSVHFQHQEICTFRGADFRGSSVHFKHSFTECICDFTECDFTQANLIMPATNKANLIMPATNKAIYNIEGSCIEGVVWLTQHSKVFVGSTWGTPL